jgi:hypothetical protein
MSDRRATKRGRVSNATRRFDMLSAHWRYRRWGTQGVCYYCGCIADSEDHVPPISLAPIEPERCEDMAFWLISACRECNVHLGNLPVLIIGARKRHLVRQYRSKYRKELSIPDWQLHELAAMGYNLRKQIVAGLQLRDAILARMGVLDRECLEPTLEDYRDREPRKGR